MRLKLHPTLNNRVLIPMQQGRPYLLQRYSKTGPSIHIRSALPTSDRVSLSETKGTPTIKTPSSSYSSSICRRDEVTALQPRRPYTTTPLNTTANMLCPKNELSSFRTNNILQIRTFRTVGEYHDVADDALHLIQDEVEALVEDNLNEDGDDNIPEVNYSDGVLTMNFPPHGTWVINKQTPNQQLWWSSPLSGPRRYEYDQEREKWVYTRVGGGDSGGATLKEDGDTLGSILTREIKELYGWEMDIDV